MKLSTSLAKALCNRSIQSGNGQFANHTCCTMHRNVNIEIVMVQAAAGDEHSKHFTTVNPDVILILHANWGIVMSEWMKTKYTDVHLNIDKLFARRCCFHAWKCQPQLTESMLAQLRGRKPWRTLTKRIDSAETTIHNQQCSAEAGGEGGGWVLVSVSEKNVPHSSCVLLVNRVPRLWCGRCLLITECSKTPGHYKYLNLGPRLHPLYGIGGVQFCDLSCSWVYCSFEF